MVCKTIVNSQASILGLKNLMAEFFKTFNLNYDIDDIFYYGVFCKEETYANFFKYYCSCDTEEMDFEIPGILCSVCETTKNRIAFVKNIIKDIMEGKCEKPEWMKYIELNYQPTPLSTFLYIKGKTPQYEFLATALKEYLYSTNNNTFYLK